MLNKMSLAAFSKLDKHLQNALRIVAEEINDGLYNKFADWRCSAARLNKTKLDVILLRVAKIFKTMSKIPTYEILPGMTVLTGGSSEKSIIKGVFEARFYYPAFIFNCRGSKIETIGLFLVKTLGHQNSLVPVDLIYYGYIPVHLPPDAIEKVSVPEPFSRNKSKELEILKQNKGAFQKGIDVLIKAIKAKF